MPTASLVITDQNNFGLLVAETTSPPHFYPERGQLESCAKGHFELVAEVDGTEDYRLTSEHWLKVFQRSVWTRPKFQLQLLRKFAKSPLALWRMVTCLLLAQSWNWQFRGERPPMQLLRQTWRKV